MGCVLQLSSLLPVILCICKGDQRQDRICQWTICIPMSGMKRSGMLDSRVPDMDDQGCGKRRRASQGRTGEEGACTRRARSSLDADRLKACRHASSRNRAKETLDLTR